MSGDESLFCRRASERGYILLVLLLFVALLSIGFLAMVERVDFQSKRDREEELIHRGVQYARAVRKFVKKFGRYPTNMEELENTNNIRFLRKRYKDPITGRDFKIVQYSDLRAFGSRTPGVSVTDIASQQQAAAGALNKKPVASAGVGPSPIPNASSQVDQSGGASGSSDPSQNAQAEDSKAEQDPSNAGTPAPPLSASDEQGATATPQLFTGGGVVGVASYSKIKTIRIFNKQDHYNQWQFVYDPGNDKGLMQTPRVPLLPQFVQAQQENGQRPAGSSVSPEQQTNDAPSPNPQASQEQR